jgi:hypothetical protein
MANGLFLSLPLHGHTNPSLPLVRQLVRGDEIVYSHEPFAGSIEHAGALPPLQRLSCGHASYPTGWINWHGC